MPDTKSNSSKPGKSKASANPSPKPVAVVILETRGEFRRGQVVTVSADDAKAWIDDGAARRASPSDRGIAGHR